MRADGVLTSIDLEGEHQRLARQALTEAGVAPNRVRLIAGRALDVMSRLTDGGYDLVFIDGDKAEYGAYFEQALRLLRPGGVVAFDNALWHDRVADPSQRDPDTVAIREVVQTGPRATSACSRPAAGRRRPAARPSSAERPRRSAAPSCEES